MALNHLQIKLTSLADALISLAVLLFPAFGNAKEQAKSAQRLALHLDAALHGLRHPSGRPCRLP